MKYNRFGYLIGEGFSNVLKNKKSTMASLMIMCATMIIFGISFAISENINHFVAKVESNQGVQVFVKNDATDEQIDEVGKKLHQMAGISNIEFKSSEAAFNQVKEMMGDQGKILDGIENDFMPASYIITFDDLTQSKQIQEEIKKIDNVEEVKSSDETTEKLIAVAKGIKIVTGVILALLVIISIFIISNTIKLTVHVRRKEISIMKYVGATNNFIRWPFIVEGMIIGVFASMLSIGIVGGGYTWFAKSAESIKFMQDIGMQLMSFPEMLGAVIGVYLILGIGIGALGSIISMRKYLKV